MAHTKDYRKILHISSGRNHGAITRLVSPADLGKYLKPFVFLDYLFSENASDIRFGYHPHSGIATLTYPLISAVEYEDTTGKNGIINEKGLEWMASGGGAWHQSNFLSDGAIEGFQVWIALPPALENGNPEGIYVMPEQVQGDDRIKILLGSYQQYSSLIKPPADINYFHLTLKKDEEFIYHPPKNHAVAWFFVHKGNIRCDDAQITKQIAILEQNEAPIKLTALGDSALILGTAPLHDYPLVMGRYSVHTSHDALELGEAQIMKIGRELQNKGII